MTFSLKFTKLTATLDFPSYSLPYWLGNKFRGGFGSVLLKAVCGYLKPQCDRCSSSEDCLYYALYVRDKQKRGKSQPVRPIVFIPPFFGRKIQGSGVMNLEINVFGDYIRYIPHIIYGLRFLGKIGLNAESRFELVSIKDAITGKEVYDGESIDAGAISVMDLGEVRDANISGDEIEVQFTTPVEARIPVNLPFLIHMIRRRLILYVNEYGKGTIPDYKCNSEILYSNWKEHSLIHTSKRHGRRVFHGITGYAKYRISEIDNNSLKLLRIGELIGAGAKASFGMGFFKLSGFESPLKI